MNLPRSAADVLADHVTLELECIDRMYMNLYVPKLAFAGGIAYYFRDHRGQPFVSSALMEPITRDFVGSIHQFIADKDLDLVHFKKGERKEDIAHGYLAEHDGTEGVAQRVGQSGLACSGEAPNEHKADSASVEVVLGEFEESNRLRRGVEAALLVTDTRHLDPHVGTQSNIGVQQSHWQVCTGEVLVGTDESLRRIGVAQPLEVHGQEGHIGSHVTAAEMIVELEAVEDPRSVVEAVDVIGLEVSVAVADLVGGDAGREQRLASCQIAPERTHHGVVNTRIEDRAHEAFHRRLVRFELIPNCTHRGVGRDLG